MPVLGVANKDIGELRLLGDVMVQDDATGRVLTSKVEWLNASHGNASHTGIFGHSRQEAVEESTSGFDILSMALLLGTRDPAIFVMGDILICDRQGAIMSSGWEDVFTGASTSELLKEQTTGDLSPLVVRQVQEIVTAIRPKLRERLSRFGTDLPGQVPVSPSTMSSVNELVAWLCSQSGTVDATVSSDGMLSVAAVFPKDVRLYVEIERDGSVEAAVTRDRRYANDVSTTTVADLTPEEILAAVGSI